MTNVAYVMLHVLVTGYVTCTLSTCRCKRADCPYLHTAPRHLMFKQPQGGVDGHKGLVFSLQLRRCLVREGGGGGGGGGRVGGGRGREGGGEEGSGREGGRGGKGREVMLGEGVEA